MRLFGIADLHLPSSRGKDMARFGWGDHPLALERAWDEKVAPSDVVIVAGDISWATRPKEALGDLAWLEARPGRKVLLRGNHDYWWGDSSAKLRALLADFQSIAGFVHNSAVAIGPWLIAGSRLWTTPEAPALPGGELGAEPLRADYVERESRRLAQSIDTANAIQASAPAPFVRIVAAHFPPLYLNGIETVFSRAVEAFKPAVCVYGHLHGPGISAGFVGERAGVRYVLASCDAAKFSPLLLHEEGLSAT